MGKIKMVKSKNPTVGEACNLFIRKCRVKNLTENSIRSYEQKLVHLKSFIGEDTLVENIDRDTVDDYVLFLRDKHKANDITINSYLRSARAFLYYCMECDYMSSFKIHLSKTEKKIKETYSDNQLQCLLMKPDTRMCKFSEYKTWAFENYLLGTGNRISSALNVKIKDIDFENRLITLTRTKNRKQQIVPLSNSLGSVLIEYLEIRGGESDDYLFCNDYGLQSSTRTYQQLVKNYNIKRNVNITSCHAFRHTFAKHFVMAGGDVFRLQKLLGHSDLTVTKEYVAMFGEDLQLDFDKFNPLDTLIKGKKYITM